MNPIYQRFYSRYWFYANYYLQGMKKKYLFFNVCLLMFNFHIQQFSCQKSHTILSIFTHHLLLMYLKCLYKTISTNRYHEQKKMLFFLLKQRYTTKFYVNFFHFLLNFHNNTYRINIYF